jgi:hypothetical protein
VNIRTELLDWGEDIDGFVQDSNYDTPLPQGLDAKLLQRLWKITASLGEYAGGRIRYANPKTGLLIELYHPCLTNRQDFVGMWVGLAPLGRNTGSGTALIRLRNGMVVHWEVTLPVETAIRCSRQFYQPKLNPPVRIYVERILFRGCRVIMETDPETDLRTLRDLELVGGPVHTILMERGLADESGTFRKGILRHPTFVEEGQDGKLRYRTDYASDPTLN